MNKEETPFTAEQCTQLRECTINKSREIAEKISNILNQKNSSFAKMAIARKRALELREKKLRRFLNHLMSTRENIGAADYGRCTGCGRPLCCRWAKFAAGRKNKHTEQRINGKLLCVAFPRQVTESPTQF